MLTEPRLRETLPASLRGNPTRGRPVRYLAYTLKQGRIGFHKSPSQWTASRKYLPEPLIILVGGRPQGDCLNLNRGS